MSRFGDDIRKIAKYDELKRLIDQLSSKGVDPVAKGALNGARGVAYFNGGNAASSPGTSSPDSNTDKNKDKESTGIGDGEAAAVDSAKDALNAVQTGSGSDDLTNPDNTNKDGYYDAKSILDGAKDAYGKAVSDGLINSITGLTTEDATRDMLIHLKDAALSFVPPDDWVGPYSGGTDPTYTAGYYYQSSGAGPGTPDTLINSPTLSGVIAGIEASWVTYLPTRLPAVFIGWLGAEAQTPSTNGTARIQDPTGIYNIPVTCVSCSVSPDATGCPLLPPTAGSWTDLGLTQLAFVTPLSPLLAPLNVSSIGRFIPNPYDVNVPSDFADGNSILDLKTVVGDTVRIGPLKDGGWYMYYSDGAGAPVGAGTDNTVFTVKNDRKPGGFITPNQLGKLKP